jgi:putative transposase
MLLTYRYKLKPTKGQYAVLERLCGQQQQLYNAALQERIEAWKKAHVSITKLDQFKSLTQIRQFDESYAAIPVALSRWTISRVDDAFTGFFSRVKRGVKAGFPRFKARSRWRSFGFAEWSGIRLKGDKLLFKPFAGGLKLNLHRPVPDGTSIKSCTFTRLARHWFITMAVDVPVAEVHSSPGAAVGIDVGVSHLATTSDGLHILNIRPKSRHERQMRVAQRALARCKKGSNRRRKVRNELALLHRRIANVRSNHLHQVSAHLAKVYSFIAVEKLQVKNMTRSAKGTVERPGTNVQQKAGLNDSMLDASFTRLITFLTYKAERAGGLLVKVAANYTSQDCSSCGERVSKTLAQRTHRCACGTVLQRDHNSGLNILYRACDAHQRARPLGDGNVERQLMRHLGNMVAKAA